MNMMSGRLAPRGVRAGGRDRHAEDPVPPHECVCCLRLWRTLGGARTGACPLRAHGRLPSDLRRRSHDAKRTPPRDHVASRGRDQAQGPGPPITHRLSRPPSSSRSSPAPSLRPPGARGGRLVGTRTSSHSTVACVGMRRHRARHHLSSCPPRPCSSAFPISPHESCAYPERSNVRTSGGAPGARCAHTTVNTGSGAGPAQTCATGGLVRIEPSSPVSGGDGLIALRTSLPRVRSPGVGACLCTYALADVSPAQRRLAARRTVRNSPIVNKQPRP